MLEEPLDSTLGRNLGGRRQLLIADIKHANNPEHK